MNVLDAVPKKSDDVEEIRRENSIHIVRDRRKNASVVMRILIWAHQTPRYHRIDIEDPIGMRVWELIDGGNSVGVIADIIGREFGAKEQFKNAEGNQIVRLTIQFLRMLFSARLIHY